MTRNFLLPLVLVGMVATAVSGCATDGPPHRFNDTHVPSIVQEHAAPTRPPSTSDPIASPPARTSPKGWAKWRPEL